MTTKCHGKCENCVKLRTNVCAIFKAAELCAENEFPTNAYELVIQLAVQGFIVHFETMSSNEINTIDVCHEIYSPIIAITLV